MTQDKSKKSSPVGGINYDHDFRVRIPFATYSTNIFQADRQAEQNLNTWNEHCARAIEMFGLPGEKYTCRFTANLIEFWFLEEKDAMLFELTCG